MNPWIRPYKYDACYGYQNLFELVAEALHASTLNYYLPRMYSADEIVSKKRLKISQSIIIICMHDNVMLQELHFYVLISLVFFYQA